MSKSIAEIKKCIGDDIQISKVRVSPGMTNTPEPEKISGGAQEDKVPGEGEVYYDIRFSVYLPGQKEKVKMIINVEAQKDSYPGYEIPSRGIYYGARMISAQKGTEFSGSDYDRIKKGYSIWICMNAPDHIGNASPLPGGGTHPQHIMISPLNINRMVLDQFFHDNMGARSPVVNITHNMKMVYRQPLDQLT